MSGEEYRPQLNDQAGGDDKEAVQASFRGSARFLRDSRSAIQANKRLEKGNVTPEGLRRLANKLLLEDTQYDIGDLEIAAQDDIKRINRLTDTLTNMLYPTRETPREGQTITGADQQVFRTLVDTSGLPEAVAELIKDQFDRIVKAPVSDRNKIYGAFLDRGQDFLDAAIQARLQAVKDKLGPYYEGLKVGEDDAYLQDVDQPKRTAD